MNYEKHYNNLIEKAKRRTLTGYYEKHHIFPKCLGGEDSSDNIVNLTPEEHYVAHQLLVKIYNHSSLVHAAVMMTVSGKNNFHRSKNKLHGWLRRRLQFAAKKRIGKNNSSFGKPWYYNPKDGTAKKFLPNEVPNGWVKGRSPNILKNCLVCNKTTPTKLSNYCSKQCRYESLYKDKTRVVRTIKEKLEFADDEKVKALLANNGNIRRALFSLGLNDSGPHYRKMKILKASVYPLATNQLKG